MNPRVVRFGKGRCAGGSLPGGFSSPASSRASGIGQVTPAAPASRRYLATTPWIISSARAMASRLRPALCRYCSTSLILRMDSRSCGISALEDAESTARQEAVALREKVAASGLRAATAEARAVEIERRTDDLNAELPAAMRRMPNWSCAGGPPRRRATSAVQRMRPLSVESPTSPVGHQPPLVVSPNRPLGRPQHSVTCRRAESHYSAIAIIGRPVLVGQQCVRYRT